MAMIYCRECGYKHSDRARACPKCGYTAFDAGKSVAIYIVLLWLFGLFGAHKFYAGKNGQGLAMLMMFLGGMLIFPFAILAATGNADVLSAICLFIGVPMLVAVSVWVFVDFIVVLCNIKRPDNIFANK